MNKIMDKSMNKAMRKFIALKAMNKGSELFYEKSMNKIMDKSMKRVKFQPYK